MIRLQKLSAFDTRAFYWCNGYGRSLPIRISSRWISRLGDGGLYLALGIGLALWEEQDGEAFLLAGLLAYAIELPFYLLLKNTIRRDRPCHRLETSRRPSSLPTRSVSRPAMRLRHSCLPCWWPNFIPR
jgi:undecaprenyl-diphosphatase